nr:hypothetical protein [Tanacetum cinerariifolium]
MLVTQGEGLAIPTETHYTPSPQEQQSSHHATLSSLHLTASTETIPTKTPTEIPTLRQYSKSATQIAQSKALSIAVDKPASLLRDDSQREAFPTARIKLLEDKDRGNAKPTGDDAPIKGRSMEIGEEVRVERSTERGSNDTEEMVNVLTSMEAANILTSGVTAVSVSPVAGVSTVGVPTVSGLVLLRRKRKGLKLEQWSAKKMKTSKEVSEEYLKEMMQLVHVEEVYVEALQVQHPIIDWEIHSKGKKDYWKINRLGGNTAVYQFFVDMLKHFDREDLKQLWALVKETLSIRQASSDKEMELWVELKRLFELDFEDQLWTHTQNLMHDPLDWKLYDTCGVHHVFTKDQEIFMLVERNYPLRKRLAIVMICNKLQVENYLQMANDLIMKIHNIANSPR